MTETRAPSFPVSIFIAGDLDAARATCRRFCMTVRLCVTVTPTEYIYTGGAESGVIVGLINYPRFPAEPSVIFEKARALALHLMDDLCQRSASLQTPSETVWLAREEA